MSLFLSKKKLCERDVKEKIKKTVEFQVVFKGEIVLSHINQSFVLIDFCLFSKTIFGKVLHGVLLFYSSLLCLKVISYSENKDYI